MFFQRNDNHESSSDSDYDQLPPVSSYRSEQKVNGVIPIAESFLLLRKKDDYEDYEAFSRKKIAESDVQSNTAQQSNGREHGNSIAGTEAARSVNRVSLMIDQESQTRAMFTDQCPQDQESQFKELLDLEIKKNRELEHRLFLREKVIIELRAKNEENAQNKRKTVKQNRSASPKVWASRTVRKIQEQIRALKSKYEKYESIKSLEKSKQKMKRQNTSLRHQNRKYQKFFKAFSDSLAMLNNNQPVGRDVKDVWECWKLLFPKIAQNISK